MLKSSNFVLTELCYFFLENTKIYIQNLIISFLYLLTISLNLALIFNFNSFQFNIISFFLLFILIFFYSYYTKENIKLFIENFRNKFILIKRLKGNIKKGKLIIYYLVISNSILAVLFSYFTCYYLNNLLIDLNSIYLFDFSNNEISLFLILFTLSTALAIINLFHFFFRKEY